MKKIIEAAQDLIDTIGWHLDVDHVDNHEIMQQVDILQKLIKQPKSGENKHLIKNICEYLECDDFPGEKRTTKNTLKKLFYFAVMYRWFGEGLKVDNGDDIMEMLGRDRTSKYHYKYLLQNDNYIRRQTMNFLKMYQYESELI